MKILYPIFIIIICWGCTGSKTEKHQSKRDNIINVRGKLREIKVEDVFISNFSWPYVIDNYLIISDYHSYDKQIHIFDKNSFGYVTSIADKGKGPGEIVTVGHIVSDKVRRKFYVSDLGKQRIFSYDLDSVLVNPSYIPQVKMETNQSRHPLDYMYVNDTLCFGTIVEPTGESGYNQLMAKWNMITGEIKPMKYTHPDIEKKRVSFAASIKRGIYAECYHHHDLMTVCSLDGELKYNVYGNKWDSRKTNSVEYYGDVAIIKDKIMVLYSSGDKRFSEDGQSITTYPTKFLVFDINGDYFQTLETEYWIVNFCYDEENNRIIVHLDDEMQFAYIELDGLLEK